MTASSNTVEGSSRNKSSFFLHRVYGTTPTWNKRSSPAIASTPSPNISSLSSSWPCDHLRRLGRPAAVSGNAKAHRLRNVRCRGERGLGPLFASRNPRESEQSGGLAKSQDPRFRGGRGVLERGFRSSLGGR